MQELVIMKNKAAVTTSLQIADSFDKKHQHVLRDIDALKEDVSNFGLMFCEGTEPDAYGRPRRIYFISRDGFFLLAMGFTGKKALSFKQKYIEAFNEMETVIRKNTVPQTIEDMMIYQLEDMKEVKKDVSTLKDTMRISGQQEFEIKEKANKKVVECLGGKESPAYKRHAKKVFSNYWRDFKQYFHLPRYGELPRIKFDEALSYIDEWLPNTELRMLIKETNRQGDIFE
ncbi:phage regulatory protein [Erwinia sp. CPCC 100877]|nr:phage regulatory protein [Erwinia sp. CPCC 100877]